MNFINTSSINTSPPSNIIVNKYRIEKRIGEGKFGVVYSGTILKKNIPIAIKMESQETNIRILKHETTILNHLYRNGCRCIPMVYWFGVHFENTCLIMNFYKCSLNDYSKTHNMTDKMDIFMAKLIELLENIHKHYVVHRDIKPDNFMFDENNDLHMIDFGMATIYINEEKEHIPYIKGSREFVMGSNRFMSYNVHNGDEPVRRDDLISIGYLYLYYMLNGLPWDNIQTDDYIGIKSEEMNLYSDLHILNYKNKIRKGKKSWEQLAPIASICNAKIYRYLDYCYHLSFDGEPCYDALKMVFLNT